MKGTEPTGMATNAETARIAVKSAAVGELAGGESGQSSTSLSNEEVTM